MPNFEVMIDTGPISCLELEIQILCKREMIEETRGARAEEKQPTNPFLRLAQQQLVF